ncbi:MAG: DegQ family serine endoprotease [Phycisphaerae bacterium]|nr:DegQ family serine endoprotease [Phycisphaerae bacterium]
MKLKQSIRYGVVLAVMVFGLGLAVQNVVAASGLDTLRETSKAFAEVSKKVIPAVVSVQVEKSIEVSRGMDPFGTPFDDEFFERFFGRRFRQQTPEKRMQKGQGSGFIISADGYILTNNHVVGEADKILVAINDGRELQAKVIGTDPKSDVALIKVEADNLPVIDLGDSDKLEIGEWVIAVGNPFGLSETVTVGVVSAKSRSVGIAEYEDFIQTDAAINPGNSGGPLLNLEGQAIGINSAIFSQSGGYMGIGFAIPINMAKNIKEQLLKSGKVTRGYVGIEMDKNGVTPDKAKFFGLDKNQGVIITRVLEDSPAAKGGLKDGDVVIKLNGKEVVNNQSFRTAVSQFEPGTKVELTVVRNNEQKDLTITIGSLDDSGLVSSEAVGKLGLEISDIDSDTAERFGFSSTDGVIVTKVARGSVAEKANIRPGMVILSVNRQKTNSVKDFNAVMKKAKGKVLLLVRNEDYAEYIVLELE